VLRDQIRFRTYVLGRAKACPPISQNDLALLAVSVEEMIKAEPSDLTMPPPPHAFAVRECSVNASSPPHALPCNLLALAPTHI